MRPLDLSVYLVTDADAAGRAGRDLVATVHAAAAGGITAVQVRDKRASARELLELTLALARVVPPHVALLVNDRVDVFCAARRRVPSLAGVHVGQSDLPLVDVRALVGADAVVGVTASTDAHLMAAAASAARVDYVGIGTVRATATKPDAPAPLGIDGVVRQAASVGVPAVAIGGIRLDDVAPLRAGGLAGVAVASAICAAADPAATAQAFAAAARTGAAA